MTKQETFMMQAYKQALLAQLIDEVPVGCVIVHNDKIIARGYNKRHTSKDATTHAEIIAIRKACKKIGDWRLNECDLYVTLEPCAMCAGACVNSRIKTVYFATTDIRSGGCVSVFNITSNDTLNHKCEVVSGVLQEQCSQLISNYFKAKRESRKQSKSEIQP